MAKILPKVSVAVASVLMACLVSAGGFLFVLLAPIGVFILVYGRQSVEGAPGHGAAFVFWCGPVAAASAFFTAVWLSFCFYRQLSKRFQ